MYMSRLQASGENAFRVIGRSAYDMHRAVWRLFGDREDRKRDFLYRRMEDGPGLLFYAVSARPPADPDGLWRTETREYAPRLAAGQRLSFSLRVNPVRTGRNERGGHARFDVVMDAKHRLKMEGKTPPPAAELVRSAGLDWLAGRADRLGVRFEPDDVLVAGYRVHDFLKKGQKVSIATLDFDGACTVADPAALERALFEGIGPAKGFGCGLMLVRRG
jgi:CRISPR system Cascade subunit CasE